MQLTDPQTLFEEFGISMPEPREYIQHNEYGDLIAPLKAKRREMAMGQAELAELCNTRQSFISEVENHKSVPSLANWMNLCNGLGLEIKLVPKDDE